MKIQVVGLAIISFLVSCASFQPHQRDHYYKEPSEYSFDEPEPKKLQSDCLSGAATSCLKLGDVMRERDKDPESSIFYNEGCEKNNADSCVRLGLLQEKGAFKTGYYTGISSEENFAKGCDLGSAFGCHRAAFASMTDAEKRAEYLGKACKLGDKAGCSGTMRLVDSFMSPAEKCKWGDSRECGKERDSFFQQRDTILYGSNNNGITSPRKWFPPNGGLKDPRFSGGGGMCGGLRGSSWVLNQVINGFAVFRFVEQYETVDFIIAVKGLDKASLAPNIVLAAAVDCMHYLGEQNWDNIQGFGMKVKTYEAIRCPVK